MRLNVCAWPPLSPKYNIENQYDFGVYPQLVVIWPTQIGLDESRANKGTPMRLDRSNYRVIQSDERSVQCQDTEQSLLTPARRAALDALEREFRDLLQPAAR
jgi:hypothetical protein